jgi:GWxTD domain-containing protein
MVLRNLTSKLWRPGPRARRGAGFGLALWVGAMAAIAPRGFAANGATRLQEITDKWRNQRARDFPIEMYLRPVVAADPAFNRDPKSTPESLSPPARQVWDSLHLLLNTELQAQYLGLSNDSLRAEWVRRYWRLRDPTPTTPENERLEVHQKRVAEARSKFGMKDPPGWDDRGVIWIQFGEPDSDREETARSKTARLHARPSGVALSRRPLGGRVRTSESERPWKLGRSSAKLSYRPDLVARDRERLGYDPRYEPPTPAATIVPATSSASPRIACWRIPTTC